MKKQIRSVLISIFISLFYSCNCSDKTIELNKDYFIRIEGKTNNDILGKQEIQANVLRYNYNDDFIIAEQKPNKINDAIYEKVYDYKDGRNNIYYWIILVKQDSLLGPLSKSEFKQEKIKYNIPNDLVLKRID